MVRHELASGEYNRRRAECETGVKLLQQYLPGIRALRDVDIADLEKYKPVLPNHVYRRCRHVVAENQRVLVAAKALQSQDVDRFGHLMYQSHASLRDDYEVSCKELDLLVDLASSRPGVYGARMTGGGFGGCTVNLIGSDCAAESKPKSRRCTRRKLALPLKYTSASRLKAHRLGQSRGAFKADAAISGSAASSSAAPPPFEPAHGRMGPGVAASHRAAMARANGIGNRPRRPGI